MRFHFNSQVSINCSTIHYILSYNTFMSKMHTIPVLLKLPINLLPIRCVVQSTKVNQFSCCLSLRTCKWILKKINKNQNKIVNAEWWIWRKWQCDDHNNKKKVFPFKFISHFFFILSLNATFKATHQTFTRCCNNLLFLYFRRSLNV